jgi:DMSO/TMAO reductase YedYZ heme-binding membrane subunit
VSGFVLPIAFSLLRFVPWPAYWISKFNAIFIYPPALGSRHNQAILGIAHVPTRGQAFFILYLITINVVLSSVGYHSKQPNGWYTSPSNEIMTYVTNRVGVLSFANVPLLILYAGRNNILLQLTNWSHGTFLLLHRWVAFLCTVEAVIHSAIYLKLDVANASFSGESKLPYWIWGSVATLGMSILLLTSIYPLRRSMYELFLAWHIALSILIVVGCYLHILYRFQHQWGYEVWMFVAMAVWGFDRVMRVAKLARNGLKTATVTTIDENYVRVDVGGVFGDGHAYLYFPTLTWRVWENHPFSVASSILMPTSRVEENPDSSSLDIEKSSVDAAQKQTILSSPTGTSISSTHAKPGMTFFIRTRTGLTSKIRHRTSFPVLVESPYSSRTDLSEYSHLICIAGGVGITAVLPYLRSRQGRKKLLWGVRKTAIVDEMSSELKGVDTTVFIGERMNVRESLTREIEGIRGPEKVVVVSSGPEELADSIRREVTVLARQGLVITLLEEAFDY